MSQNGPKCPTCGRTMVLRYIQAFGVYMFSCKKWKDGKHPANGLVDPDEFYTAYPSSGCTVKGFEKTS